MNERIPAHFTLKAPFEADDIVAVEDLLGKLFLEEKKSCADVMKFLDDERPCFELSFDNVCIFQRLKDKWVVYKKFNLG